MRAATTILLLILACAGSNDETGRPAAASAGESTGESLLSLLQGADQALPERGSESSPLWPQITFLEAESKLRAGDPAAASRGYRQLVEWAAGDPHGDGLGGSGLAIVALWRQVELLDAMDHPLWPEEIDWLGEKVGVIETHLARRMFRFGFLDALPHLEAELRRKLALLYWRSGKTREAREQFLEYLELSVGGDLGPDERALRDSIIASQPQWRDRLAELQARRLEQLRRHEEALPLWESLVGSESSRLDASARLHVAQLKARLFAADRTEIDRLLTAVIERAADSGVVDQALLARASAWAREGAGQDVERAKQDLTRILDRHPRGPLADDALLRLAGHHRRAWERTGRAAELERALALYARLRELEQGNDWLESAHFQPAMIHYARGGRDDLGQASSLLEALVRTRPDGALGRAAAFWSARILEERGEAAHATVRYRALIAARPYDYYAVRARMHLSEGARAAGRLWPGPEVSAQLAADYRKQVPYAALSRGSPYHRRLTAAIDSGLYRELLAHRRELRGRTPGERLQNLPLAALDRASDLERLALLLALRQDALAAAARPAEAGNALEVHAAVALGAGDLPLAMAMAIGSPGTEFRGARPEQDPRFLHSAYPPAFIDVFQAAAQAERVPGELLYALSRRESLFDPAAISTFSARGLFQFIPSTFEVLDQRWKLLERSGARDRDAYLLNPELNAHLGARWLADELIHRQNCVLIKELGHPCTQQTRADPKLALVTSDEWFDATAETRQQRVVLLALMEHSRGYTAVRGWLDRWRTEHRDRDLEYMIETAGAAETRVLVRGVLTDASIAAAIGIFAEARAAHGRRSSIPTTGDE